MIKDPFDIRWLATDPKGRDVVMLHSTVAAREKAGKHPGAPDRLDPDDARLVIEEPSRIDRTTNWNDTYNYYKISEEEPHPYARVTVRFIESEDFGIAVSWSRYERPASLAEIDWPEA